MPSSKRTFRPRRRCTNQYQEPRDEHATMRGPLAPPRGGGLLRDGGDAATRPFRTGEAGCDGGRRGALPGHRPAPEAHRRREERRRAEHLHLRSVERSRPGRGGVREEVRHQDDALAIQFRERAQSRCSGEPRQPFHRRHRRDQRPGARGAAPRTDPAARQEPVPRGSHRARHPSAWRMGGDSSQRLRAGLQHQAREEGGPAEDVGRPRQPEMERQAGHRTGGHRLAGRRVQRDRRGEGPEDLRTSSRRIGSRRGRAIRSSPSSWSRARCPWPSRSTTTRPSS